MANIPVAHCGLPFPRALPASLQHRLPISRLGGRQPDLRRQRDGPALEPPSTQAPPWAVPFGKLSRPPEPANRRLCPEPTSASFSLLAGAPYCGRGLLDRKGKGDPAQPAVYPYMQGDLNRWKGNPNVQSGQRAVTILLSPAFHRRDHERPTPRVNLSAPTQRNLIIPACACSIWAETHFGHLPCSADIEKLNGKNADSEPMTADLLPYCPRQKRQPYIGPSPSPGPNGAHQTWVPDRLTPGTTATPTSPGQLHSRTLRGHAQSSGLTRGPFRPFVRSSLIKFLRRYRYPRKEPAAPLGGSSFRHHRPRPWPPVWWSLAFGTCQLEIQPQAGHARRPVTATAPLLHYMGDGDRPDTTGQSVGPEALAPTAPGDAQWPWFEPAAAPGAALVFRPSSAAGRLLSRPGPPSPQSAPDRERPQWNGSASGRPCRR